MKYWKSVFQKLQIRLAIAAGISLLLFSICLLIGLGMSSKMVDQQFSERWCKDDSFSQVSMFFSELAGFKEENVQDVIVAIEDKIREDAILPHTENEDAKQYVLAYSARGTATLSFKENSIEADAIGIGGDYFLFHPFKLLYGSFVDGDEIMKDGVVIDSNIAWNLYGSVNIVGREIMVGDRVHFVRGVIERDSGRLNDLAGNSKPTIYMSCESLSEFGSLTYVNSLEGLLPNPISGYAKDLLSTYFVNNGTDESRYEIVENTGRFNWTRLFKIVKQFGTRGMNTKGIVYPFWENKARGVEDYLAPLLVASIIFVAFPTILFIMLLMRMWKKRTIHKKDIWNYFADKLYEYRAAKKERLEDGEFS